MKSSIAIGYLPLLDHLTLGIAIHNERNQFDHFSLRPVQFSNWQTIADALKNDEIDGAFLLFPLALKLYRENPDIRLVMLGHREGQVLVVDKNIQTVEDLRGKTVQVPDLYSTHTILLDEIVKQAGMSIDDVVVTSGYNDIRTIFDEMDEKHISGLIIAEPIATEARKKRDHKVMKLSQDFHPHHIDCVLVVKDTLIQKHPDAVQELVESLVKAGAFINAYPRQAAEIGESFLGWPKKLLIEALTHDEGHITFWDLLPRIEDFEELQKIAVDDLKLWKDEIDLEPFIRAEFAQKAYRNWVLGVRRETKDKGIERTLPGNFEEAANRLKDILGNDIEVRGISFIYPGQPYPHSIKRLEEVFPNKNPEAVFETEGAVWQSGYSDIKALFTFSNHSANADIVLLKVSKDKREKIGKALHFGTDTATLTIAEINLEEKEKWGVFEKDDCLFYILPFEVYRFLSMLLVYFKL